MLATAFPRFTILPSLVPRQISLGVGDTVRIINRDYIGGIHFKRRLGRNWGWVLGPWQHEGVGANVGEIGGVNGEYACSSTEGRAHRKSTDELVAGAFHVAVVPEGGLGLAVVSS